MATIPEILSHKFPTREWRMDADDYGTLIFMDAGPVLTESAIRAFSAEVDGMLAQEVIERRQGQLVYDKADALVTALDILAKAVQDMQGKLKPASLTGPLGTTEVNRITALVNRITTIKSS